MGTIYFCLSSESAFHKITDRCDVRNMYPFLSHVIILGGSELYLDKSKL